eukprot:4643286-Prymnesium_polylepis.1
MLSVRAREREREGERERKRERERERERARGLKRERWGGRDGETERRRDGETERRRAWVAACVSPSCRTLRLYDLRLHLVLRVVVAEATGKATTERVDGASLR